MHSFTRSLPPQESVCRDIQSAKVSISWIGMLTTRFILITSTLDVYDLPTTVLDPTRHRLHLSGSRPLKDIYPVIYKDQKDGTSSFLNTTLKHMTTVDGTSEYLYGETRVGPGYSAHLYDLQSKKLYKYSIKDQAIDKEPILCLSTTDPNSTTFYILTPKNNKLREGKGATVVGAFLQLTPTCFVLQALSGVSPSYRPNFSKCWAMSDTCARPRDLVQSKKLSLPISATPTSQMAPSRWTSWVDSWTRPTFTFSRLTVR